MATVGNLVVNLGLNRRKFDSGIAGARRGVSTLAATATRLGAVAAAVAAPLAAIFGGRAALNAARTQIQAEQKLESVIRSTGGAAGLTAQQIKDYAAELQSVTNFGDEATISAAGVLATFTQVRGDVFRDAIASAQDLSAVLGTDLQSSMLQIGKALNDPARGVLALTRSGVSFTQQQREQIKLLQEAGNLAGAQAIILGELQTQFGGAAKAMADPWTQFKNTIGDIAENIGFLILPAVNAVSKALGSLLGPVSGASDGFRAMGQVIGDWVGAKLQAIIPIVQRVFGVAKSIFTELLPIGVQLFRVFQARLTMFWQMWGFVWDGIKALAAPVLEWLESKFGITWDSVKSTILDALIIAEFAFRNWQDVAVLGFTKIGLEFVTFGAQIKHFFTGVLPALFDWFAENWQDLLVTNLNFSNTVWTNIGKNAMSVMRELWDFIKSGGKDAFEPTFTSLTEGFVSTIKELPDIPERVVGPLESALQQQVNDLSAAMGTEFAAFREERLAALDAVGKLPEPGAGAPGFAAPTLTAPEEPGAAGGRTVSGAGALVRGTAGAISAALAAARGDRQKQLQDLAAKQLEEQKKMNAQLQQFGSGATQLIAVDLV